MLNISDIVVGNSSSGIIETPSFKRATVNVGIRQEGRIHPKNVIDVDGNEKEIIEAIKKALYNDGFKNEILNIINPFGNGDASKKIVNILKNIKLDRKLLEKKLV